MKTISFADLGLGNSALSAVEAKGFEMPTPIQILAIPRLLTGEANIIAKARTGTGKTAAFGLPLIEKICEPKPHPQALVLTPTRELALQVCKEITSFSSNGFPRLAAVYGGQSMREQLRALKQGVEIVVGTPGRIKDHLERGSLKLESIDYFILDEADEMLDMGFIDDIEFIFSKANTESRILLFSATMPSPILKIAANFMGDYEIVEEEAVQESQLLIEQKFWYVRENEKAEALVRLIDISPDFYGLIFTQTKVDADATAKKLDERGYDVAALHGDIPQNQREKILSRFRNKKTRILVATDVAARGIDIEGLTHVVNYALPFDAQTYVHRIGRTGRAGAKGLAFTLVRPDERRRLDFLRQAVRKTIQGEMSEAKIPSIKEVLNVKRNRFFSQLKENILAFDNENDESQIFDAVSEQNEKSAVESTYIHLANQLCDECDAKEVLARVLSWTFAGELNSSRYGSVSEVVLSSQRQGGRRNGNGNERYGRNGNSGAFVPDNQIRIYVSLGRRDGYNAAKIATFFSQLLHIPQRFVDRIDVSSNFSLVSLPAQAAKDVVNRSSHDKSLPHMHIDTKADFGDHGGRRSKKASFHDESGSHSRAMVNNVSLYKKAGKKRKDA